MDWCIIFGTVFCAVAADICGSMDSCITVATFKHLRDVGIHSAPVGDPSADSWTAYRNVVVDG